MENETPLTSAAWNAAKEQTDTNDNPDWGCVAHDMRDKCAELERKNARLREALRSVLDWAPVPPDHWRTADKEAFIADMVKAREVLDA